MKEYVKLKPYKFTIDDLSKDLNNYKFEIQYFTHFPRVKNVKLQNILLSHFKCILLCEGECELYSGGNKYILKAGDMMIIPPFTLHDAKIDNTDLDSYEIFFNIDSFVAEELFRVGFGLNKIAHFHQMVKPHVCKYIASVYKAFKNKDAGYAFKVDSLLKTLLVVMHDKNQVNQEIRNINDIDKDITEKMIRYLNKNKSNKINVTMLCESMNISQSYLYRCVKNVLHESPQRLIQRYKMMEAERLLRDFSYSIGEISLMLGYDNAFHFSTTFKKEFQISPSTYRKTIL